MWDNVLDVNLKSMMLTTKYAAPKMIDAGGGSIINMSSIAGVRAGSGLASIPLFRLQVRRHRHVRDHGRPPRP